MLVRGLLTSPQASQRLHSPQRRSSGACCARRHAQSALWAKHIGQSACNDAGLAMLASQKEKVNTHTRTLATQIKPSMGIPACAIVWQKAGKTLCGCSASPICNPALALQAMHKPLVPQHNRIIPDASGRYWEKVSVPSYNTYGSRPP
jgi:hypothetical protein